MTFKQMMCRHCGTTFQPHSKSAWYCDDCRPNINYSPRNCARCEKVFYPRSPGAKYCDDCRELAYKEKEKKGYVPIQCERCGKTVIPTGTRQRFCDMCRPLAYAEKVKEWTHNHPRKRDKGVYMVKPCATCGTIFIPNNPNNKYCIACAPPKYETPEPRLCPHCEEVFQPHSSRNIYCKTCSPIMEYEKDKERARYKRREKRMLILRHYSKSDEPYCDCCGESVVEFLCVDHINGGGNIHRRKIGTGADAIYNWIINNNFPEGFRVLCQNCNSAYSLYGQCPHKQLG